MHCLKIIISAAAFAALGSAAGLALAALPLTDKPGSQQREVYLHLADNESRLKERGILNGYKGYRHHRPGYRRNSDNWWYPRAAFEVESALPEREEAAKPDEKLPVEHIEWCSEKYRSYRREDNSFQPYDGPRRRCRSPHMSGN